MASKKRDSGAASLFRDCVQRASHAIFGPGRSITTMITMMVGLALLTHLVWRQIGSQVLQQDDFLVTPEKIHVNAPPEWIDADVRSQALTQAQIPWPQSLLDPNLCPRLAQVFQLHPWVASVERVARRYPARLDVLLRYRRPVAMVRIAEDYLRPIDADGTVLPHQDFSPAEALTYPQIEGVTSSPLGIGTIWPDPRVLGAAKIARVLADKWHALNLRAITPAAEAVSASASPTFCLLTHGNTRIFWGRPPGQETDGEPNASEKIAKLLAHARMQPPSEGAGPGAEFNRVSWVPSSEAR